MLATKASGAAMFNETMRRVRLEKLSVNRNCPARLSHPSGRCQPLGRRPAMSALSTASDGEPASAFNPASGCVRSSNGQHLPHRIAIGSIAISITFERDLATDASRLARGKPAGPRSNFASILSQTAGGVSAQTVHGALANQASLTRYLSPYGVSII